VCNPLRFRSHPYAAGFASDGAVAALGLGSHVEFIAENGGGRGVRLSKGREPETIPLEDLNASNDE
jgi:hypothetical protein